MIQLIESTLIVCVGFALVKACWLIWYEYRKPPFLPFSLLKWLCSFGKNSAFSSLPQEITQSLAFKFTDPNYDLWLEQVVDRDRITRTEYFHFQQQLLTEIQDEQARRSGQ
ncbi:hypothetical protein ACNO5E_25860 [Vibrio parahaemolyticus]|uniref:hypothetical protein n=1 Tax=Vibrio parahaemolyticus TaxID=670 RepID=UPI000812D60C|nr:hypothetical protein [Vibrio parahaemolyticus]OCP68459.1 hypothetical protein AKH08_16750 [Vibrio parahaemolyticus]